MHKEGFDAIRTRIDMLVGARDGEEITTETQQQLAGEETRFLNKIVTNYQTSRGTEPITVIESGNKVEVVVPSGMAKVVMARSKSVSYGLQNTLLERRPLLMLGDEDDGTGWFNLVARYEDGLNFFVFRDKCSDKCKDDIKVFELIEDAEIQQ